MQRITIDICKCHYKNEERNEIKLQKHKVNSVYIVFRKNMEVIH